MPTVKIGRARLFAALGKKYEDKEFEDLCFRFGIELDDITTEKAIMLKERHIKEKTDSIDEEEIIYKIEVPANRCDLLCLEGLAQALRVFEGSQQIPTYSVSNINRETMLKMHVKPETYQIRPFVVCAVLRDVTFDEARYNSFIDLQEKLHQNICRQRTLVAIGTHDLDTIQGPFSYEALPPSEINFVPLKQAKNFRADELMEFYKSDSKLEKFLEIIEKSPVYPVIYDHNRTVLSMPPIINGSHSAITHKTKNIFIECTATDWNRARIVLNVMVTMFSCYCERKFEVEPVEVIYSGGQVDTCPDLSLYDMKVPLSYINSAIGISLQPDEVTRLLQKMQIHATHSLSADEEGSISVNVPPTRCDVFHPCDIMEDVAIAFGYNKIPKGETKSLKALPLSELTHLIRPEIAMAGFLEVCTFRMGSYKENFAMLNGKDNQSTVIIGNPRSADTEIICSSLTSSLLKVVGDNKDYPKPIKIFEVDDVVVLDDNHYAGATNRKQLAALYCGATSGFELIHGLVDRVMEVLGTPFVSPGDDTGYYIMSSNEPEFLPGRQASIIRKGKRIGIFGIIHPKVLRNFDIHDPCSYVEMNINSFLEL